VLEGFGITSTPVVYSEENGNVLAQFSTQVTLAIRVYEPAKMRIIDDSVYTFSSGFQGTGKTREEAAGKLPDDLAAMHSACSNAALEYSRLIIPGEIQVKRFYYPDGDTTLVKADKDAREGKWGRAESHWKWLAYNSPDSAIQARASYNMALACERDGRLNQAMGFAKRSQRIRPDKRTLDYISVLNKRTLEFEGLVKSKVIIKRW
jgi:hypothetical protein